MNRKGSGSNDAIAMTSSMVPSGNGVGIRVSGQKPFTLMDLTSMSVSIHPFSVFFISTKAQITRTSSPSSRRLSKSDIFGGARSEARSKSAIEVSERTKSPLSDVFRVHRMLTDNEVILSWH
jgi:hypothetical protein